MNREELIAKYGIEGSRSPLDRWSSDPDQIDAAIESARRVFTPAQSFHEQIRSAAELVMTTPTKTIEPFTEDEGGATGPDDYVTWGVYDLDISDDPKFDGQDYRRALWNQAKGPHGIQRIRSYRPGQWARTASVEYLVAVPWQVETMCRSILQNEAISYCFWCFWANWTFDAELKRMVPGSAASHGMLVSCGSTTVLLGTCDECRRRFAGDLAATGEIGQIDYVTAVPDELDDDE
ncbi:hypothetical protein HYG77_21735 [Rhodococcus sp. ZPP]|uniref:hypothetical protein n=1 Tax=Rhodococcus sp. ZPP TaxID=2749906 RepID=UPI001AD89704|nr:hypothetical protein [Rhodococcus sp. ZPP]QTJ67945.1 hypothetical protein HYG77_21735 [Rhodococcus sp. ZPP]